MDALDAYYIQLLSHGIVSLRNALASDPPNWAYPLADLLHNIPGLINQPNPELHKNFWLVERNCYLEWLRKHDCVDARVESLFDEMEPVILARIGESESK